MKKLATIMVVAFGYAGAALGQTAPPAASNVANIVLSPGDAVRITVMRHPELSGEIVVAGDGTLMHPVYRELKIAGLIMPDAERMLHQMLARFEARPEFVLDPLFQVAVGGEVRQPNLYPLRPSTTIAQAVAIAGGATDRGRLDRVRLFRRGTQHMIDLSRPAAGMGLDRIQSGDQILVERRSSVFRDYIAPVGSIIGALAAVLNILTR
jgi:polysaccharide export outer membrane protein